MTNSTNISNSSNQFCIAPGEPTDKGIWCAAIGAFLAVLIMGLVHQYYCKRKNLAARLVIPGQASQTQAKIETMWKNKGTIDVVGFTQVWYSYRHVRDDGGACIVNVHQNIPDESYDKLRDDPYNPGQSLYPDESPVLYDSSNPADCMLRAGAEVEFRGWNDLDGKIFTHLLPVMGAGVLLAVVPMVQCRDVKMIIFVVVGAIAGALGAFAFPGTIFPTPGAYVTCSLVEVPVPGAATGQGATGQGWQGAWDPWGRILGSPDCTDPPPRSSNRQGATPATGQVAAPGYERLLSDPYLGGY